MNQQGKNLEPTQYKALGDMLKSAEFSLPDVQEYKGESGQPMFVNQLMDTPSGIAVPPTPRVPLMSWTPGAPLMPGSSCSALVPVKDPNLENATNKDLDKLDSMVVCL